MKRICQVIIAGFVAIISAGAAHAGGPENVLLVVNSGSANSLAVANHYIHLRKIPALNVVYLNEVPGDISCSASQFREKILLPVLSQINERKIGRQIDYIVYSTDFPTTVEIDDHVQLFKAKVSNFNRSAWIPRGSINSLTFHFQEFLANNPSYLALDANWFARRTVRDMLEGPFVGKLQETFQSAINEYQAGNHDDAIRQFSVIIKDHPRQVAVRYYLARALAAAGKDSEALKELELCVRSHWCYRGLTENDPAFAKLKEQKRFQELVEATAEVFYGRLPSRGFEHQAFWGRNGWINGTATQGKQFVLSTMLGVTAGRGNSLEEVIANLQRSRQADGKLPQGTFFFARHDNIRSKTRQNQFAVAMRDLRKMGFRAEIIPDTMPINRKRVLGVTLGSSTLNWSNSRSIFEPGAIADNLTSFGGRMGERASQTPLTHYLKHGAAGASGTVAEPLAIANKFPDSDLHVHYASGCTLAEAFYQSIKAPFQLLIVGDPLCAPWARFPQFSIEGLEDGQTVDSPLAIKMTPAVKSPPIRNFEVFLDGRQGDTTIAPGNRINIDFQNLSDGYHELRVVANDNTIIATQSSRVIGFIADVSGKTVNLEINGNGKYQLARTITLQADANVGDKIDVYQNSRLLGTIAGQSGDLTLNCADLGQGPTRLQAIVESGGKRIASRPVELEIIP